MNNNKDNMVITQCTAKEIKDSRNNPTIEVTLSTKNNAAIASVPSGKSTGLKEAVELRDPDGRGVERAINNIENIIGPNIMIKDWPSPTALDAYLVMLDGTTSKSSLGANSMLAVSIAATKLFAKEMNMPLWQMVSELAHTTPGLPHLYMNVINGGAHADFKLPFQEYILLVGKDTAHESYETAKKLFEALGEKLKNQFGEVPHGDEGGYVPPFTELDQPFETLAELIKNESGVSLAIDAAASGFFENGRYFMLDNSYSREQMLGVYDRLVNTFPLTSIEDGFFEDDIDGFKEMTAALGEKIIVMGDDLTVTNSQILDEMIAQNAGNALIIKPNQIGTLVEVYRTVQAAHKAGWKTVVSHRSGETLDTFIADLSYGLGAYGLKAGAPSQGVRRVKYERLVEIEKEAGKMQL